MCADFDLNDFIPYRLAVAAEKVSRDFAKRYRESYQISRADWRVLYHLATLEGDEKLSIRDLKEQAHLEKSKVSRSVSRLEKRGLLTKQRDDNDQRLLNIQLTPEGREIFLEIAVLAKHYNEKLVQSLGDHSDRFLSLLEQLKSGP